MAGEDLQLFDQRSNYRPFGPVKSNYHTSERKEQEKYNEGAEQKREKRKKAMLALLVLILATLGNEKADAWLKSILAWPPFHKFS